MGLELLEHAALMAGPKYHCLIPAFRGVQAVFNGRFAEGEELFATCREMAVACGAHGVAGSTLAGDDDAA